MRFALSLGTSAGTLAAMWLAGRKSWWAWVVGLANQILWFLAIILFEVWGLLPLAVALTVMYALNLIKWRREESPSLRGVRAGTKMAEDLRRGFEQSTPPGPEDDPFTWRDT